MNDYQAGGLNDEKSLGQLIPAGQTSLAIPDSYGLAPGYGGLVADRPELFGLNFLEIWRILYKRKWVILGIAAAFVALNAVRTLMETPLYTAAVRLQVDRVAKIVEGGDVMPQYA